MWWGGPQPALAQLLVATALCSPAASGTTRQSGLAWRPYFHPPRLWPSPSGKPPHR